MKATYSKTLFYSLTASFVAIVFLFSIVGSANAQSYSYTTPVYWQYGINTQNSGQYQYQNQYQQIQQLIALIAQLEAILAGQGGSVDRPSGNSMIDVSTNSADDIEDDEARLRGEVDFNSSDYAYLWFEWGEDRDDLDEETPRIRRDDDEDVDFSVLITDLDDDQKHYFRAVGEDEDDDIDYGSVKSFTTDDRRGGRSNNDDDPDVQTDNARNVDEDSAELEGEVDMNDFNNGTVFFVYGLDEDQVEDIEDDYDTYNEVDEDGDDLQKEKVDSDLDDDESYEERVTNLEEDEEYFFSICVEYEDDDDDDVIRCGDVENFDTDGNSSSNDDEPNAITGNATDVEDDSADFDGEVDMNDFNNGVVFFVYGEDEDQIDDIENDYDTYSDVDEDGDDLQKIKVDSDLDGDADYDASVFGLDNDTRFYYSICVEYDDDDDVITCGSTRSFRTDN